MRGGWEGKRTEVVREGLIKKIQSKGIVKEVAASVGSVVRLLHCNEISFQIHAISTAGLATAISRPNAMRRIKGEGSQGLLRISKLTSRPLCRVFSFGVKYKLILTNTARRSFFHSACVCVCVCDWAGGCIYVWNSLGFVKFSVNSFAELYSENANVVYLK